MTDIEKESISMSLDAICKKLYEKANPTENFDLDALRTLKKFNYWKR